MADPKPFLDDDDPIIRLRFDVNPVCPISADHKGVVVDQERSTSERLFVHCEECGAFIEEMTKAYIQ